MKNILIGALVIIAIAMLYLGITQQIIPPALTGISFLLIAGILKTKY